jgi:GT2 family glycosyltransferase
MIKILVSIVNYNSYDDTLKVVDSILNKIDISKYEINFFIVDNSSDKSSQQLFLKTVNNYVRFSLVNNISMLKTNENYIFNVKNHGFGAANNIVINYVRDNQYYDVIWLLNNDLELDVNCLSALDMYLKNDNYHILGSTIVEENITVSGTDNMSSFKGYGYPSSEKLKQNIFEVDAVVGTSMFLKRKFLKDLSFDENFFMYVEENDLCYRFRKIGIKSYIVRDSKVYHHSGKTFGDNQSLRWYYKVRNLLYFKSKNNSKNILLIPYLLLSTVKMYKFNKSYLKAYFYGVYDYLNNIFGKTNRNFK